MLHKKSLQNQLLSLKRAISESRVITPREIYDFVFLCGANIDDDTISKRRSALLDFAKNHPTTFAIFLSRECTSCTKKGRAQG